MKRKEWAISLLWAVIGGGIVAVLTGEQQAISLRIWLATFAVWFAAVMLQRATAIAPVNPVAMKPLFGIAHRRGERAGSRLRELRSLHALVLRSEANDRAFVQQLRPRLIVLADHFLEVHHGIERRSQPERAAALLGDTAWMLDEQVTNRSPTIADLDAFVEAVTPAPAPDAEEAA